MAFLSSGKSKSRLCELFSISGIRRICKSWTLATVVPWLSYGTCNSRRACFFFPGSFLLDRYRMVFCSIYSYVLSSVCYKGRGVLSRKSNPLSGRSVSGTELETVVRGVVPSSERHIAGCNFRPGYNHRPHIDWSSRTRHSPVLLSPMGDTKVSCLG